MARIRSIHPEACDSEKLAALSDSAERTFFRLLTHTDDEGRAEDRPKLLAAKLYPLHDDKGAGTVDTDLDEIQEVGLLVRYSVDGRCYLAITTFGDWQKPRHPTPSKLPAPGDHDSSGEDDDGSSTDDSVSLTAERGNATDTVRPGEGGGVGGGVGGGEGGGGADAADATSASPSDPIAGSFADFWQRYPRHSHNGKPGGGGSRKKAWDRWRKLKASDREQALVAVDNYREWCERPEGEFAAHATTWLNEQRWEQWQEPAAPPTANGREPPRTGPLAVSTFTGHESFGAPKR